MVTKIWVSTDGLFARPSFLSGAARVLDLGGTFDDYNGSSSEQDADYCALQGDWAAIGSDLQKAIESIK